MVALLMFVSKVKKKTDMDKSNMWGNTQYLKTCRELAPTDRIELSWFSFMASIYSLKSFNLIKKAIIVRATIPENFPILNTLTKRAANIRLGMVIKKAKKALSPLPKYILGAIFSATSRDKGRAKNTPVREEMKAISTVSTNFSKTSPI